MNEVLIKTRFECIDDFNGENLCYLHLVHWQCCGARRGRDGKISSS